MTCLEDRDRLTSPSCLAPDSTIDLDIISFKALIDRCKAEKSYTALLARLQAVFSSLSRLSMSFADVRYGHRFWIHTRRWDIFILTSTAPPSNNSPKWIPRTLCPCSCRMFSKRTGFCVSVRPRLKSLLHRQQNGS
jgi:hypothetical protein